MIKTMSDGEMLSKLQLLPAYTEYIETHPDSLLTRCLGMYKVASSSGTPKATSATGAFLVTNNVFYSQDGQQPVIKYDLKGSVVGRRTRTRTASSSTAVSDDSNASIDNSDVATASATTAATPVLKDLNLVESGKLRLGKG
jgi:Phosphatidylinositol-4-phosphate 5-Kinase